MGIIGGARIEAARSLKSVARHNDFAYICTSSLEWRSGVKNGVKKEKPLYKHCRRASRGLKRIRTAVQGFADLCLATRPSDHFKFLLLLESSLLSAPLLFSPLRLVPSLSPRSFPFRLVLTPARLTRPVHKSAFRIRKSLSLSSEASVPFPNDAAQTGLPNGGIRGANIRTFLIFAKP